MINKIISFFIIILIGSTIKRTIEEECPEEYKESMKNAPWYIKIGEKF